MKKIITYLLVLAMLVAFTPAVYAQTDTELVDAAKIRGLFSYTSYNDNELNNNITRAELAGLICSIYEGISGKEAPMPESNPYTDVPESSYNYEAIMKCAALKIIEGYINKSFDPNSFLTREQAAACYARTVEKLGYSISVWEDEIVQFPDVNKDRWSYQYVQFVSSLGVIKANSFNPTNNGIRRDAVEWAIAVYDYCKTVQTKPVVPNWQDEGIPEAVEMVGNEFQIHTAAQLAWIAQKVNVDGSTFQDKVIRIMADIDLSGREWTPIGSKGSFMGTICGDGHVISGLTVGSREWPATNGCFVMGYSNGSYCSIYNLAIKNSQIYGGNAVFQDCALYNCYSNAVVGNKGYFLDALAYGTNYGYKGAYNSLQINNKASGTGFIYDNKGTKSALTTPDAMLPVLNDNANELYSRWIADTKSVNNGWPVFKGGPQDPDYFWIGDQEEIVPNGSTYEVYTPQQLAWIAGQVNSGKNSFSGKTFKLMNSIDLSNKYWTPIGGWNGIEYDSGKIFSGIFDGNNKTISGLTIGKENSIGAFYVLCGFFGNVNNSTIKNTILDKVKITNGRNGLCNYLYIGSGALCGFADNSTINSIKITGDVTDSNYIPVGGVVGYLKRNNNVFGCSYFGNVRNISSINGASGICGGLVGDAEFLNNMSSSYSSGSVSGGYAGGLVGSDGCDISNCYSTMEINGGLAAGGIIGKIDYTNTKIERSYSLGNLISNKQVGGIIGITDKNFNDRYTITYTRWNRDAIHKCDGIEISDNNKKSVGDGSDTTPGNTLAELKQQSTYTGWDFSTVWAISPDKNGGLPYLRWQEISDAVATKIVLSQKNLTLYRGETSYLSATFTPANVADQSVTWTSSAPQIAKVDSNGKVTAISAGIATITATSATGLTDTCTVSVKNTARPITVTVNKIALSDNSGNALTAIPPTGSYVAQVSLNVIGTPSDNYYIMLVGYDSQGRMRSMNYLMSKQSGALAYGCMLTNKGEYPVTKLKAFVIDGLSSMMPLGNAVQIGS